MAWPVYVTVQYIRTLDKTSIYKVPETHGHVLLVTLYYPIMFEPMGIIFIYSTHPTEKQDSDPLVASSVHRTPAQNSQREGRSPVFQWDVWIGVGSSAETARFLRNPENRRTRPSYMYSIDTP